MLPYRAGPWTTGGEELPRGSIRLTMREHGDTLVIVGTLSEAGTNLKKELGDLKRLGQL